MTKIKDKSKEKDKRLMKTYGISYLEWVNMYEEQLGVCWICKTLPPSGRLSVDHIHVKGFKSMVPEEKKKHVRGLLCFLCNTGLKNLEKTNNGALNRQRLNGTYAYFQKFRLKGEE
jgi:hypothetical protein